MTARFDGYIIHADTVLVPGRIARRLYYLGHLDSYHRAAGGVDPEEDAVLTALRRAGDAWASTDAGTNHPPTPEPAQGWFTTSQAAEVIGITARGVRKAIAERRLDADESAGAWRISREAIAHFTERRTT